MNAERTLPEVVNSSMLGVIIGGFLARYPANTRACYTIHLRQWLVWCDIHGLPVLEVKRGHIEAWARHLNEERGLKMSSVASKLNAVCGMYKFAAMDGFIAVDPAAHVRRPRIEFVSTTVAPTRAQLADMLTAAEKESPTSYALMCLLALNGLRVGELLAADIDHLGFERGYRTLHLPHRKGGKVATLALSVRTAWAIDKAIDGRTSGPLLLGRNGQRLHVTAARRTIRRLARQTGYTKRVHPHAFRHSFVTLALDAGVAERDIMASTGHSSGRMVAFYDRNRGAIERNATHAVSAFVGAAG